jgi:hypothetical protein
MYSRSELSDVSIMWQNKTMKGMNGDWVIVLHIHVKIDLVEGGTGIRR